VLPCLKLFRYVFIKELLIINNYFFLPCPILLAIALLFGRLLSTKQLLHNYNLEKYAKKWCYVQFNGK